MWKKLFHLWAIIPYRYLSSQPCLDQNIPDRMLLSSVAVECSL